MYNFCKQHTLITTMTRNLIALSALVALSLTAPLIAEASNWRGTGFVQPVSADQVDSYPLVIESSGDEADVYYPNRKRHPAWRRYSPADLYPVVLMMQGANVDKEYYSILATGVARQGFIVVVPNQRNRVFGGTFRYSEVHTIDEVLEQMRLEDASPDSPVYGIADTNRFAIMGHSFGGAATMFAVEELCSIPFCDQSIGFVRPPELRAVVLTSSNTGAFDFDTSGVPIMIISGSLEEGRPRQLATYDTLEPPKALVTVEGGTHYAMCDADVPPGANAKETEPPQALPNGISAARYAHWAGLWLRAHVHDDAIAARKVFRPVVRSNGITVESER